MRRHFVLAALVLALAGLVSAQAFREKVRVGLIAVRLDARGRDGRTIQDLKAGEVKLLVDGNEIAIDGLEPISRGPLPTPKPAEAAVPSAETLPAPGVPTPEPVLKASVYLAILLDETATNSLDRRDVHRQIENFLGKLPPDTNVMLQRFDGRLRTECPWTTEKAALLAAAKKISKRTFDARMPSPASLPDEIRNGRKPKDIEAQIDLAARRSFDGILQALLQFPDVAGRKGLAFISDGTPLMSPFDLSLMLAAADTGTRDSASLRAQALRAAKEEQGAKDIEMQLSDEALSTFTVFSAGANATWNQRMAAITRKAVELDIAFYPVDSEALERGTNPGTSSKWPGRSMPGLTGGAAVPVNNSGLSARIAVGQSMDALARATGGEAVLVPNQFADRLEAVAADRVAGYELTFRDPTPGDGRFHKIEIQIARPGTTLSYRRGYRIRSDEERILDAITANLHTASGDNPLNAKLSFNVVRKEGARDIVTMVLEFPQPPEAPAAPAAERDIRIWAICSDDDGNRAKPISRSSKARRGEGLVSGSFADSFQLGLPPGPYVWSVALQDVATGLTSYLVVRKEL
ncbi:MAG TPA: VWA domain-containing protein [Thermoanaerobaculia bacterium]|nr:VWA domain-containing protein [Thermoanaerobaculia bacterium]